MTYWPSWPLLDQQGERIHFWGESNHHTDSASPDFCKNDGWQRNLQLNMGLQKAWKCVFCNFLNCLQVHPRLLPRAWALVLLVFAGWTTCVLSVLILFFIFMLLLLVPLFILTATTAVVMFVLLLKQVNHIMNSYKEKKKDKKKVRTCMHRIKILVFLPVTASRFSIR